MNVHFKIGLIKAVNNNRVRFQEVEVRAVWLLLWLSEQPSVPVGSREVSTFAVRGQGQVVVA